MFERYVCVLFATFSLTLLGEAASTFAEIEAIEDLAQARAAVREIADDDVLAEIAQKSKDWRLRADAVYFLRNQGVVEKVLASDADWRVRVHAVSRVVDLSVVEKYALTDANERVRAAAGRHTRDASLRLRMVAEDKSEYVRRYVAEWIEKDNLPAKPRSPYVEVVPIPEVHVVPEPTLPGNGDNETR